MTSVAGVITFTILSLHHHGPVAPDWPTGIALGIGGLAGAYTGARIQSRLPDLLIRRLVGAWWSQSASVTCGLPWADRAMTMARRPAAITPNGVPAAARLTWSTVQGQAPS